MMGTTIPVYAGMTPVVEVRPMGPGFRRGDTFIFGRRRASEGVSRRKSRCPGPLEVEAAEVAGDVDDLADEIEAGHVARKWKRRSRASCRKALPNVSAK